MRKVSLFLAALLVIGIASYAGAQCCGTANVTSTCQKLDPSNPTATIGGTALTRGCVDDGMGDCAGGIILDTSAADNGGPELIGGCACVAGQCIAQADDGDQPVGGSNPIVPAGADQCATAANQECSE